MKYTSSIELSTQTFNWLMEISLKYPVYKQWIVTTAYETGARGMDKLIKHMNTIPDLAKFKPNPFEVSKAVHDGVMFKEQLLIYFKNKSMGPVA